MSWLPDLVRSFTDAIGTTDVAPEPAGAPASPAVESIAQAEAVESDDPRNRRTAERHDTEVAGRVRLPTAEHDCKIIDLSTGGMNVMAPEATVSVGQQVAVVTQNFPRLAGIVRWARDGMFGVQFPKPIAQDLIDKMGRLRRRVKLPRAPRATLELPSVVYFDGKRHPVMVGNISVGGLMMETRMTEKGHRLIRAGQPLMIEFPEHLPIGGHVRWSCGDRYGVMFSKPLALPLAEELQRTANLSPTWLDDVRQAHEDIAPTSR